MHFVCRSFIGKHGSNNWAQFWENESDDLVIASKKGHIFGLINISTPEVDPEIIKVGKEIISEINQFYYSSPHDQIGLSLQYSLDSIKNSASSDIISDLILVVVHQNTLYSGIYKSGLCTLSRGLQISRLLEANGDSNPQISGEIISGDKILLSTGLFLEKISWEKIKNIISEPKIQNIEENFLSELYTLNDQSGVSALLIQVNADEFETAAINEPLDSPEDKTPPPPPPLNIAKSQSENRKLSPFQRDKINFFKKFFSPKSTFVSSHDSGVKQHRTKINNIVAIVILIALGLVSYFGFNQNRQRTQEAEYQKLKTEIEAKIANSRTIKNMNLEDAIKEARDAQSVLDKIIALKVHPDEVEKYKSEISQILSKSGSASDYKPEFFTDAGVIIDKPQYSRMILNKEVLLLIDSAANRIDSINLSEKSNQLFSQDKSINKGVAFAVNEGKLYTLTDTGVSRLSKDSSEEIIKFSGSDPTPHPVALYFWTNSLYLLDPANSAVWKSTPGVDSVFASPQAWLKAGEKLDTGANDLAINGKVWILSSSGRLTAYTRGVKENFTLQPVSTLTKTDHLNVAAESEIIVFSDNDNIVYVYDKSGKYQSSYNYGGLKILDLVLDEKNNQIFVLCSDQKIYKISL